MLSLVYSWADEQIFSIAERMRYHSSKSGDEQISFKEYVDRMKEGQNDNYSYGGALDGCCHLCESWEGRSTDTRAVAAQKMRLNARQLQNLASLLRK